MQLPTFVSSIGARQILLAKRSSPDVLFAAGVGGMITSTILACKATLSLSDTLKETQNNLEICKSIEDEKYKAAGESREKDIAFIYVQGVWKVVKLYGPSIVVGVLSIGCLTRSHRILSERNMALSAAYAAVDNAFKRYRGRVIEKYGEDEDRLLRYDHEEVRVINPETNRHKAVLRVTPEAESMYARFFDQLSAEWSKEAEYNFVFLRAQQNYWNDMLRARGHVFLNEVYKSLGIDHSQAGAVVGWVVGDDGDNYIDFGVFRNEGNTNDFVNGREGSILLDFNVDGVIYDKIEPHKRREIGWQS